MDFSLLPRDILLMIMEFLPKESVVALCSTDKKLKTRCEQIQAEKQALFREAPLSKPSYNTSDQLHLIDRGFKTLYHINLIDNRLTNVIFGFPFVSISTDTCLFEIVGLPPPRGTEVFIIGRSIGIYDLSEWQSTEVMVFESKDRALDFVLENIKNIRYGPVRTIHSIAQTYLHMEIGNPSFQEIWREMVNIVKRLRDNDPTVETPEIFHYVTLP